jgi:hypothetical protein
MATMNQPLTMSNNRLMDLERVVEMLNGQLRALKQELHQAKSWSAADQLQANFLSLRRNHLFMSAICNRRIRPNTRRATDSTVHTAR